MREYWLRIDKMKFHFVKQLFHHILNDSRHGHLTLTHINTTLLPPGGCHVGGNSISMAILHGRAENVFPHKRGYARYAGG